MMIKAVGVDGGVAPGFKTSSFLIDNKILLDAGSVASGLPIAEQILIDHILISHAHLDHICELAYLCDNCFGLRDKPFEVYATKEAINIIKNHLFNDVLWPDFSKLPTKENPTIRFNEIEDHKNFKLGDYDIRPLPLNHNGGAVGYLIEREEKSVLLTMDTGPNSEEFWSEIKGLKNLVAIFTEVSFPNRLDKVAELSLHHTPMSLEKEIEKMPENIPLFIGHLKPNYKEEVIAELEQIKEREITILESNNHIFSF